MRFGAILDLHRNAFGSGKGPPRSDMLDLLFLAIGLGVFALFGAYAASLRKI
jgi:hypothetical protein